MIIVSILRGRDNDITGIKVTGHAEYADPGEDIVCAAVSAVTVGTVNSIEALTGTVMKAKMKSGFLNANLPGDVHPDTVHQVQLLLSSMVVMLRTIEGSYGMYIQIKDVNI